MLQTLQKNRKRNEEIDSIRSFQKPLIFMIKSRQKSQKNMGIYKNAKFNGFWTYFENCLSFNFSALA